MTNLLEFSQSIGTFFLIGLICTFIVSLSYALLGRLYEKLFRYKTCGDFCHFIAPLIALIYETE